ncbi:MAG TPA: pseudouridine synthase [Pseudomonadales bacterium]
MRLDQFVSQALLISRSDAKRLIKSGCIQLDGKPCKDSARQLDQQHVHCDDQPLALPGHRYLMLNKPAGYVCSHQDDGYPSALQLLPAECSRLLFAGRLDADSTGLVLLSSDGQWCHRITSPKQRQQKSKRYRLQLAEPASADALDRLQQGILLHGESRPTLPCRIEAIDATHCHITLQEGRYHQVKRMFAAIGNRVITLHREQIGALQLDEADLPPGHYRALSADEVALF